MFVTHQAALDCLCLVRMIFKTLTVPVEVLDELVVILRYVESITLGLVRLE